MRILCIQKPSYAESKDAMNRGIIPIVQFLWEYRIKSTRVINGLLFYELVEQPGLGYDASFFIPLMDDEPIIYSELQYTDEG